MQCTGSATPAPRFRSAACAALEGVRGNVLVFPVENLVARQDGVAVWPCRRCSSCRRRSRYRHAPPGTRAADARPVLEAAGAQAVAALHFLQEHDVGSQGAEAVSQLMHGQSPVELRQALVHVVTGNVQGDSMMLIICAWPAGESPPRCWAKSSVPPPPPTAATGSADARTAPG